MSAVKPTAEDLLRRAMDVCYETAMGGKFARKNAANLKNQIAAFLESERNASILASHRQPESAPEGLWPALLEELAQICNDCQINSNYTPAYKAYGQIATALRAYAKLLRGERE